MKHIIAFITLTMASLFAHAGEWGIVVYGASMHFAQRDRADWNQANDGFGVRYEVDRDLSYQVGHYRNSQTLPNFNFFTNYVVADYTPIHRGRFDFGGFVGGASGYDDYDFFTDVGGRVVRTEIKTERPVIPVGGLLTRVNVGVFNFTTRIAPNVLTVEGGFKF